MTWKTIDAVLQRVVNAVMFAIMRATGWPRSVIRYRLAMGPQVMAGVMYSAYSANRDGFAWGAIAFVLFVGLTVIGAKWDLRNDESAEAKGLAREARRGRVSALLIALMNVIMFAVDRYGQSLAGAVYFAIEAFLAYAAATPPNPPAARRAVVLATQGAGP